jgi:hypothetical protein
LKIVINKCFGGFGLSRKATERYAELKGFKLYPWYDEIALKVYGPERVRESSFIHYCTVPVDVDEHGVLAKDKYPKTGYWSDSDIERTDPVLVQVVEEMGDAANGECARLRIIEIPDGIEYVIDEYDGQESVHEKHQSWG